MINGSFVFGMDGDDGSVFERTVEWAIAQGIETATFHILTPYPGTGLHRRIAAQGRIITADWDRYDTRHAVFRPAQMSGDELERGYWKAYRDFYRWGSIARGASAHGTLMSGLRHFAYATGWKKFEPLWDLVIRAKRAGTMLPILETILSEFGTRSNRESVSRQSPRGVRFSSSAVVSRLAPRMAAPLSACTATSNGTTWDGNWRSRFPVRRSIHRWPRFSPVGKWRRSVLPNS
jgi:hypothetical protein